MSQVTGIKCDFCFKVFFLHQGEKLSEIETVTIPGIKIGKETYRLNNGHICKETCLPLLVKGLGNTKEVPLPVEDAPVRKIKCPSCHKDEFQCFDKNFDKWRCLACGYIE